MDPHLVREISVQLRIQVRLKDLIQHGKLALFLGFEGIRIVQNFSIAVAQDIRRKPPTQAEHAGLQAGCNHGFH